MKNTPLTTAWSNIQVGSAIVGLLKGGRECRVCVYISLRENGKYLGAQSERPNNAGNHATGFDFGSTFSWANR